MTAIAEPVLGTSIDVAGVIHRDKQTLRAGSIISNKKTSTQPLEPVPGTLAQKIVKPALKGQ